MTFFPLVLLKITPPPPHCVRMERIAGVILMHRGRVFPTALLTSPFHKLRPSFGIVLCVYAFLRREMQQVQSLQTRSNKDRILWQTCSLSYSIQGDPIYSCLSPAPWKMPNSLEDQCWNQKGRCWRSSLPKLKEVTKTPPTHAVALLSVSHDSSFVLKCSTPPAYPDVTACLTGLNSNKQESGQKGL